jgi:hypothetical protein
VVLKLMSKDYRTAVPGAADGSHDTTSASCVVTMQQSIKVSYAVGDVLTLWSGSEGRVPVQLHELQQVTALFTLGFAWVLTECLFVHVLSRLSIY